jgi:Kef-type K+ transport system membrane component KefB
MTATIIITICILLLLAYLFDLTSAKTRIPSVILLLLLGWGVKQLSLLLNLTLPDLNVALPALGTIGLILIVMEGALELELHAGKKQMLITSFLGALVPLLLMAAGLAFALNYFSGYSFDDSQINAAPLCVISSAIAIPTVRNLAKQHREFVVYESSFSDILGVLLFNFIAFNGAFGMHSFMEFGWQLVLIAAVSLASILGLSFLLSKITHHVKFLPIIILIILIYEVSKVYHLPGLVFILLFGLVLGNIDELRQFKWIEFFKPDLLKTEVGKFKELTIEAAFLVRALFFLLFGFSLETADILNTETPVWAVAIVSFIFLLRTIQLKVSGLSLSPLLFVAPRGLITILLFLSIDVQRSIPLVNKALIVQVILLTALVMMAGMLTASKSSSAK